ncbi:hypothetical protein IAR55_007162 [Kwoniella newhampshirensis]|uniref:Uncharacterized protein n=1 Tax=Kwoniella newhampshirensis TaxID=1651941 RepID=A0AAW0YSK5_9TREE
MKFTSTPLLLTSLAALSSTALSAPLPIPSDPNHLDVIPRSPNPGDEFESPRIGSGVGSPLLGGGGGGGGGDGSWGRGDGTRFGVGGKGRAWTLKRQLPTAPIPSTPPTPNFATPSVSSSDTIPTSVPMTPQAAQSSLVSAQSATKGLTNDAGVSTDSLGSGAPGAVGGIVGLTGGLGLGGAVPFTGSLTGGLPVGQVTGLVGGLGGTNPLGQVTGPVGGLGSGSRLPLGQVGGLVNGLGSTNPLGQLSGLADGLPLGQIAGSANGLLLGSQVSGLVGGLANVAGQGAPHGQGTGLVGSTLPLGQVTGSVGGLTSNTPLEPLVDDIASNPTGILRGVNGLLGGSASNTLTGLSGTLGSIAQNPVAGIPGAVSGLGYSLPLSSLGANGIASGQGLANGQQTLLSATNNISASGAATQASGVVGTIVKDLGDGTYLLSSGQVVKLPLNANQALSNGSPLDVDQMQQQVAQQAPPPAQTQGLPSAADLAAQGLRSIQVNGRMYILNSLGQIVTALPLVGNQLSSAQQTIEPLLNYNQTPATSSSSGDGDESNPDDQWASQDWGENYPSAAAARNDNENDGDNSLPSPSASTKMNPKAFGDGDEDEKNDNEQNQDQGEGWELYQDGQLWNPLSNTPDATDLVAQAISGSEPSSASMRIHGVPDPSSDGDDDLKWGRQRLYSAPASVPTATQTSTYIPTASSTDWFSATATPTTMASPTDGSDLDSWGEWVSATVTASATMSAAASGATMTGAVGSEMVPQASSGLA